MSEKLEEQQINQEAALQKLEGAATREKLRKIFENESNWPPIIADVSSKTYLRTLKRASETSLKAVRQTSAYMGFLNKIQCSERFESIKPKDTEMGVEGYWLGPIKYKQKESEATILYLHGGGYVASSSLVGLKSLCYMLKNLRKRYNKHVRVLAINYPLAPEEAFPIGLNCAERSYNWLVKSGIAGSKNVFICGDSAGAGLVLALLQKLYPDTKTSNGKKDIPLPLGGILISPWVELTCDALSFFTNAKFDWLSGLRQIVAECYIFGEEGNPAHKDGPSWQQRHEKDKIMEWLAKVEDTFEFADVENIWKRLSNNINNDQRRKRLSHLRKSIISFKATNSDEILKERDSIVEETIDENSSKNKKVDITETQESPYRNPLISPLHTPHHILAKFPPLLVSYGGKEMFKDDIEMFIRKFIESKKLYAPVLVPNSDFIANTFFDSKGLNINNSLDGQHPDVVVEMDEDMVHDYPILKGAFGKHSRRALDRMTYFIANRIPLPKPYIPSGTRRSKPPSYTSDSEKSNISLFETIPNSRRMSQIKPKNNNIDIKRFK
ncbi:15454_t:CDS:2 [Funneliformis geosporum]|uniref:15454_t:CDS:1 n=1 Tax=Funneliformis geosporum TaxID=1117311 RepID=A0A9W4SAP2_9GLOM|nr:15454_t:CDS:2 [Funneliformis geosporum]